MFCFCARRCALAFLLLAGSTGFGDSLLQLSVFNPLQLMPADHDVAGVRLNLLYGENNDVRGLDVGLVNVATGDMVGVEVAAAWNDASFFSARAGRGGMKGVQAAGLCNSARSAAGAQVAGVLNLSGEHVDGAQVAIVGNVVRGSVRGVQIGAVNAAGGSVRGVQLAAAPVASANHVGGAVAGVQASCGLLSFNWATDLEGAQINLGLLGNHAEQVVGAQLSLIGNRADTVKGLQVGLVNWCRQMRGVQIGAINIIEESPLPIAPLINARF